MSSDSSRRVVLVHGLWFGAWSLRLLARRLRRAGFEPRRFRYRSTRGNFDEHARNLRRFAFAGEGTVHFVAHSLGGLLTLRMAAGVRAGEVGRIVLLGSPVQGSGTARRALGLPGGKRLLGSAAGPLQTACADLPPGVEVAAICGTRNFGLGWLVGGIPGPADGTVTVRETRCDGLKEHLEMPVSHTGMLFSKAVAGRVARFLGAGSLTLGA